MIKTKKSLWALLAVILGILLFTQFVWATELDRIEQKQIEQELQQAQDAQDAEYQAELKCMADNLYFEARGEGERGMLAVALVTANRVQSDQFPDTVCGVVKQGKHVESPETRNKPGLAEHQRKYVPVKNRCQFSWYCDGQPRRVKDQTAYQQALNIASLVIDNFIQSDSARIRDITRGATHYHADYIMPSWAYAKRNVAVIGSHMFYKR